jgi:DNA-binding Lrp family transcriptional regulator
MKHADDDRRKTILDLYRRSPKARIKDVADVISLSEEQTARKIDALIAEGALTRKVVVNLEKLGLQYKYRVDVKLNPRDLQENSDVTAAGKRWNTANPQEMLAHYLLDEFSEDEVENPAIIIEDITILLGDQADLSLIVRVRDPKKIYEFITTKCRCVLGIENTSTCTEAWSAVANRIKEPPKAAPTTL